MPKINLYSRYNDGAFKKFETVNEEELIYCYLLKVYTVYKTMLSYWWKCQKIQKVKTQRL